MRNGRSRFPKNKRAGAYAVGYGRPPAQHRFKKGEPSRNPDGRRRRQTGVSKSEITDVMTEPVTLKIDGREQRVPYAVGFLQLLKSKALHGDAKSIRAVISLLKEMGLLEGLQPEPPTRRIVIDWGNDPEGDANSK